VTKLALLHTVVWLTDAIEDLCVEMMPEVTTYNSVDESLLRDAIELGELTPEIYAKIASYAVGAERGGCDALLVTCSSISPCVDIAQKLVHVPVLKIDEAMADKAVETGEQIAVVATLHSTLDPTTQLVKQRARVLGKEVSIRAVLCEGAFEAASSGDTGQHDRLVSETLRDLGDNVDVIVLAQASMARVLDDMAEEDKKVPILTSPRLGVARAKQVLTGGTQA